MQIIIAKSNNLEKQIYNATTSDNKIYKIKNNAKIFGHKYEIIDSTDKSIGMIKKISSRKYLLIDNKMEIDQLIRIQNAPTKKYQLIDSNWIIDVDITYTDYIIYDENNKKVASIKYNLPEESWEYNIDDEKNLKLLLLLLLVVMSISKS